MTFAVDKFLLSSSIAHPSPCLRAIFEALADIYPLSSPVHIGELLRIIITYSKHARWASHYPNLTLIPIHGANIMGCDIGSLLRRGAESASRFGHQEVTEMHLVLAILESQPAGVAAALSLVIAEYRRTYPQGTPRRQMMLAFAIGQGRSDWVADTRRQIAETPYSVAKIHKNVLEYLSSRYWPYGSHQWNEFRRDYSHYDNLIGEAAEIQGAYLRFLDNGFG